MKRPILVLVLTVATTPFVCLHADTPIAATGWNHDVVVENTATAPYSTYATPFDIPNNYGFYQAGLPGSTQGLPTTGTFNSLVDGSTFQFQRYTANNVLQLKTGTNSTGVLTLVTPGAYSSLSIIAAAANSGASLGNLVIHFTDTTVSPTLQFNNSDWFFQPNPAIAGFGRLDLSGTTPEDNGQSAPELYQTTLNLASLGLSSKPIQFLVFTDLATDARESTSIFALSGTAVPEPGSAALLALGAFCSAYLRRRK